ncbi:MULTISPECIES: hypothetical protein [unclassified Microbacterium]|uniref:hypothetical protein n=1 Tax=unclassified Microbacterium TaxID=2609290 RepID=UPI00300FFC02
MKWAKEQTTTSRKSYVQARRLIGGRTRLNLAALRDIVAATEDYDEHSEVMIDDTSVSVTETTRSGWRERGREGADR